MMFARSDRCVSSRKKRLVSTLFLVFLSATILPVDVPITDLTVLQVFQTEGAADKSIESVMHSSMALAMAQAGPVDADPLPPPSEHLSRDELIEYAMQRRADLILSGTYFFHDRDVTITIELIDVVNAEVIAVAEVSRPFDLLFDRFAVDAANILHEQARSRIVELVAEKRRHRPDSPAVPDAEHPTGVVTTAPEERPVTRPRFQVIAGAGRPIPIGQFGEYFDPEYSIDVLIQFNLGRVSAGVSTAFTRFDSKREGMGDYMRSFVSISTDFSAILFTVGPVDVLLRASAGAALRLHDGSLVSDKLGAALPLLSAGTGAQVWLSRRVSLVSGVSFDSMLHMFREGAGGPIGFEYIPVVRPTLAIAFRAGGD